MSFLLLATILSVCSPGLSFVVIQQPTLRSPSLSAHRPETVSAWKGPIAPTVGAMGLILALQLSDPQVSQAASYYALSDEQKLVAEAWRLTDNSYLERTFNHQDWFGLRQNLVRRKYNDMDQAYGAIADLMQSLGDKYTRFLPPATYQSMVDSATGTLAGVGVEISKNENNQVLVSDVEDKSPAQKNGIRPDDVFLEVDGTKFSESSTPDDVATRLRGPVGSKVGVTVSRDGKVVDFILTREPITITAVKSYMGSNKIGVIRIKNFSFTTAQTVSNALKDLQKKNPAGIVLDVRGNPGGLLPGGVETAGLFLKNDTPVVFVVNKQGIVDAQSTFADGLDTATPLVVLADKNTASAAEVMTAALKENNRAVIAGEQTFGKGIVQTIRELSNKNGGLAITVARYETPLHNDINKSGISVDQKTRVDCPKTDAVACINTNMFKTPPQ